MTSGLSVSPCVSNKRAQTQEPTPEAERVGSAVLGYIPAALVEVGRRAIVVKPESVVKWHRAGFRLYWRSRRGRVGGELSPELRQLIQGIASENSTWGASRIHAELLIACCSGRA
jgi:hypothetical protein